MRRTSFTILIALLLVAGCAGAKESQTPAERVRAAADTTKTTSNRLDLRSTTKAGGQDITMTGVGQFDYSASSLRGSMKMTINGTTISERMVDGVMYLQPPEDQFFYSISLKDLAGTSLAESTNPASSAELLAAMGDDTKQVGTESIKGTKTTHYKGTIAIARAKELAKSDFAKKSVQKLIDRGVTAIPTDAYLDDKGRLRRMIQDITVTIQGTEAQVRTQFDIYDFGVKVDVVKPPASQVKDGADLLKSIQSVMG